MASEITLDHAEQWLGGVWSCGNDGSNKCHIYITTDLAFLKIVIIGIGGSHSRNKRKRSAIPLSTLSSTTPRADMNDIASIRDQLQQEDFKASLVHLENLFRACLLVTVGCCGLLVIGFATWLSEGRVLERGQTWRADPKRNVARRRGESYPSSCATARPSTGAADAARTATELRTTDKQSAPRLLTAPRKVASRPPLAPMPRSAETGGCKKSAVCNVSLVATELAASKAPTQRSAVGPPTAGRRRGVPSEGDSSTRRQSTLSGAARFYAEVVNRQAALNRIGSKSLPTLAKDMPPAALGRRAISQPF